MTPVDRMLASLDDEHDLDAWERHEKRLRDILGDLPDDMSALHIIDIRKCLSIAKAMVSHYKIKLGMI